MGRQGCIQIKEMFLKYFCFYFFPWFKFLVLFKKLYSVIGLLAIYHNLHLLIHHPPNPPPFPHIEIVELIYIHVVLVLTCWIKCLQNGIFSHLEFQHFSKQVGAKWRETPNEYLQQTLIS